MAELIRLRRDRNDISFGFKLQGGSDFSTPLSILQVTPNSIADYCGLRAGDVIVELNNMDITYLEHQAAKQEIIRAGNDFTLTIIRNGVDTTTKPEYTPLTELKSLNPQLRSQPPSTKKTNLTVDKGELMNIGSSHNRAPMGFNKDVGSTIVYEAAKPANWKPGDYTKWTTPTQQQQPQQQPTVTAVFHNPYNTPIGLYSDANVLNAFNHQTKNIIQNETASQEPAPPKGVNSLSMRMLNSALDSTNGTMEQPPSVFDLKNGRAPPGVAVPKGFRSVQAPTLPRPEDRHAPVRKEYAVKNVKESWIEPKIN